MRSSFGKKMRKNLSIVALVLSICLLISVPFIRKRNLERTLNPEYRAALYFSHLQAVDSETNQPIKFTVKWDYELISPYIKGSSPAIEMEHSDYSQTITIVGVEMENPLMLNITAPGYYSTHVAVKAESGGILTQSAEKLLTKVKLTSIGTSSKPNKE